VLYGLDDASIREAFTKLLGLRNVHVEDDASVAAAFALIAHGLEFADALHLTSSPAGANFVSFDRSLVRSAKRAGVKNISGIPASDK
jgi:hypothetical protein